MVLRVEFRNQNLTISDGERVHQTGIAGAFPYISDRFAEDPQLKVQVMACEPKIMVQRYVGKRISEVQIQYLIKIISDRTERKAYVNILCKWLQENAIRWEKIC